MRRCLPEMVILSVVCNRGRPWGDPFFIRRVIPHAGIAPLRSILAACIIGRKCWLNYIVIANSYMQSR